MGNFATKLWKVFCLLVLCTSGTAPVFADPDDWLDGPRRPVQAEELGLGLGNDATSSSFVAQPSVSAAQAAARVRRLHGGRVLSVSPTRRGDALGYRVRVLVEGGRVKTVYVDSGRATGSAPSNPAMRAIGDP